MAGTPTYGTVANPAGGARRPCGWGTGRVGRRAYHNSCGAVADVTGTRAVGRASCAERPSRVRTHPTTSGRQRVLESRAYRTRSAKGNPVRSKTVFRGNVRPVARSAATVCRSRSLEGEVNGREYRSPRTGQRRVAWNTLAMRPAGRPIQNMAPGRVLDRGTGLEFCQFLRNYFRFP